MESVLNRVEHQPDAIACRNIEYPRLRGALYFA